MMQLNGYEDQHLHTTCSPDGRSTPEEMRDRARALGLRGITITDHCEAEQYFTHAYYRSVPQAYAQADALRRAGGPVEVRVGIEIGQPRSNPEVCAQLLAANDYDLVLASLHRLPDTADFYTLSADLTAAASLMRRYCAELERIVAWGQFDVLAHLTYPLRLIAGAHHLKLPRETYRDALDRVLRAAAQAGKGIEVNTQGMILPDAEVLRRFRELGGRYVTMGSDAHSARALGHGLPDGLHAIQDAGFTELTVYRHRKPYAIAFPGV